ncbi:hypothetical protein OG894_00950 [Streptomyces sp. NBC_01724]|uniref:hypothetical protein n=1 Tax=unclassified Streptomyces TaxID=2593676 RepID=UPI002E364772|nr:hypothetical protein [Streptomyces sp. NBC_01724]WTE56605.1 hypothetical protein OG987_41705 [Streptomyces sp. NBC_01620]WTE64677.1 hypothetical protein OG784_41435 [Streptomyces sp. NBC_01617]WTI91966.1 hypothetical protein OHB17_40755 [Streptomyces sp. NBC_00724]
MSTTRRPLGTGPRDDVEPELSPIGDSHERGGTAAAQATAKSPARAAKRQVEMRSQGRRQLGTGPVLF